MDYNKSFVLKSMLQDRNDFGDYDKEALLQIGNFLGINFQIFREMYLSYRRLDHKFETKPRIGASLLVVFDWEHQFIKIERQSVTLSLPQDVFLNFCGLIDSIYSEILPLGSIVELDLEMMPLVIQEMFSSDDHKEWVMITGRKLPLISGFEHYIVDYMARLWPIGEIPDTHSTLVSNMMIKRVVTKGLVTEKETEFAFNVLRASQVASKQISTAFMTTKDSLAYLDKMKNSNS